MSEKSEKSLKFIEINLILKLDDFMDKIHYDLNQKTKMLPSLMQQLTFKHFLITF